MLKISILYGKAQIYYRPMFGVKIVLNATKTKTITFSCVLIDMKVATGLRN